MLTIAKLKEYSDRMREEAKDAPTCKCGAKMTKVTGLKTTGKTLWGCPECGNQVREAVKEALSDLKDEYPRIVRVALVRHKSGIQTPAWSWFNSTEEDKREFKKYLEDTLDPLAYSKAQPGEVFQKFMDGLIVKLKGMLGGKV